MVSYLNAIVATLSLIPAISLYQNFRSTKLHDFLIFSLFFLTASIAVFASFIVEYVNILIFYQIQYINWVLTYYFLNVHSLRIKWEKPPHILYLLNKLTAIVLILIIALWKLETQDESAVVLFITMRNTYSSYLPNGAGLTINGVTILSSGHSVLMYLYSLIAIGFFIYIYLTFTPATDDPRIKKTTNLWISALSIASIFYILGLPGFPRFEYISIFLVIALVIIAYIAMYIPEGLLLSHIQIIRVKNIIEHSVNFEHKNKDIEYNNILEYLKTLPDQN